ncbi:hypothetical protein BBJ28_00013920, partial [Nothophytophthora sp. Chile5]
MLNISCPVPWSVPECSAHMRNARHMISHRSVVKPSISISSLPPTSTSSSDLPSCTMSDPNKWLGLMKWTMQHSDGTTPTEATPISEEKRLFLEKVMNEGVMDENERVKDILRILEGEDPRLVFATEDGSIAPEETQPTPEELAEY